MLLGEVGDYESSQDGTNWGSSTLAVCLTHTILLDTPSLSLTMNPNTQTTQQFSDVIFKGDIVTCSCAILCPCGLAVPVLCLSKEVNYPSGHIAASHYDGLC